MSLMRARGRTVEAMALMLLGMALQAWVPVRRWSRLLGQTREVPPGWDPVPSGGADARQAQVEKDIRSAIVQGMRRLPVHPLCLAQATAGQVMLRRRGYPGTVVIGLKREDGEWEAHAWLLGQGICLAGGEVAGQFAATTCFSD